MGILTLPKHIQDGINGDMTSLFNNPVIQNEFTKKQLVRSLANAYTKLCEELGVSNITNDVNSRFNQELDLCKTIENSTKEQLVSIVKNLVENKYFPYLKDKLKISYELLDGSLMETADITTSTNDDYSFDSLDDIHHITNEIHRRRVLLLLMRGFASVLCNNPSDYLVDLYTLDRRLPEIYTNLYLINTKLSLLFNDTEHKDENLCRGNAGKSVVVVNEVNGEQELEVKVSGLTFTALLYNAIFGVLEHIAYDTLPKDRNKAMYILERTDNPMFELWDIRIGQVVATFMLETLKEAGINIQEIGIDKLFTCLTKLEPEVFFKLMSEVFAQTNKGKQLLIDICNLLNDFGSEMFI